jgi:hypothetical protein
MFSIIEASTPTAGCSWFELSVVLSQFFFQKQKPFSRQESLNPYYFSVNEFNRSFNSLIIIIISLLGKTRKTFQNRNLR